MGKYVDISDMIGKTIHKIEGLESDSEEVKITTACGREYVFFHYQEQFCFLLNI